jgi:hypothetical protein
MKIIDILKLNKTSFETINNQGMPLHYINYIKLYDDYINLKQKGEKKYNIVLTLAEKYSLSENTTHNIIKQFEKELVVSG